MLLSLLIIGVVSVSAGAGTWAYFSDTETSTGNTFTAGTLNLGETTEFTMTVSPMAPGESITEWYNVSNAGTLDLNISSMMLTVTGQSDGSGATDDPTNLSADATAANITVTITETSTSTAIVTNLKLSALSSDQITDSMEAAIGTLAPNKVRTFEITLLLDSSVDNTMQNDGVVFKIEIGANQPVE